MALKMLHMAAITMTFRRLRKSPKKRIDDGPRGPSSIQAPRHRLWPAPITWECPIELRGPSSIRFFGDFRRRRNVNGTGRLQTQKITILPY